MTLIFNKPKGWSLSSAIMSKSGSSLIQEDFDRLQTSGDWQDHSTIELRLRQPEKWIDDSPDYQKDPHLLFNYYKWPGKTFSFWFGVEVRFTGRLRETCNWDAKSEIASATLEHYYGADETAVIKRAKITNGEFGPTAPPSDKEQKVVSTIGAAWFKPGYYILQYKTKIVSWGFLSDVAYLAGAAGLTVDGQSAWQQSFMFDSLDWATIIISHHFHIKA